MKLKDSICCAFTRQRAKRTIPTLCKGANRGTRTALFQAHHALRLIRPSSASIAKPRSPFPWGSVAVWLLVASGFSAFATPPVWQSDRGDGTYANPPLYADYPDPDIIRVGRDLPDLHIEPSDYEDLTPRSDLTAAISEELAGYRWSNRIYVSRGQEPVRLAATLIHEVNHVINRSEVGYYDDLPTSAFLHEYRAFYAEAQFDRDEYAGVDLVDYVIETYELDRSKIPAAILADPLTPRLLPTEIAWRERDADSDVEEPQDCSR
jgi:hypothetical protein